jgi:hypothetical protein
MIANGNTEKGKPQISAAERTEAIAARSEYRRVLLIFFAFVALTVWFLILPCIRYGFEAFGWPLGESSRWPGAGVGSGVVMMLVPPIGVVLLGFDVLRLRSRWKRAEYFAALKSTPKPAANPDHPKPSA